MKTKPFKTKMFIPIIHSITYHYQKAKKRYFAAQKSRRVRSWGSSLTAFSSGFSLIKVLFSFLIDRILFRVPSDRILFESPEIRSFSSGSTVIDSSLHQCSFSAMSLFFLSNRVATSFYQKQMFYFALIIILKNSLTCFNNSGKTVKKMKNCRIKRQSIANTLKIYVINFPIYTCIYVIKSRWI